MDQELVAVRWQNAQLNTSLAQARTSADQMAAEARDADRPAKADRGTGGCQADERPNSAPAQADGASRQRIAATDSARTAAEARLGDSLQQAEQEKASIGADLARAQGERAEAKQQAEREHAATGQRVAALEGDATGAHPPGGHHSGTQRNDQGRARE